MSQTPDVIAVVVTYNRADKLVRVLEHVRAQTTPPRQVIVVDNASTDGTPGALAAAAVADPTLRVHRMATNTGGAGGFAEGMSLAHAAGADLVWIMDDDCYPAPDALERLVEGRERAEKVLEEPVAFAGSMVLWRDGSLAVMNAPPASEDWGALLVRGVPATLVEICSFVSVLVPRWAIERYGLPRREYFIWFDDAEYTHRISAGGRGIQVHDSLVQHDLAENTGVDVSTLDAATLWKFRYGMRNESSFLWHDMDAYRWLGFVLLTAVRLHRGQVPWRLRLAVGRAILAGLRFDPAVEHVDSPVAAPAPGTAR